MSTTSTRASDEWIFSERRYGYTRSVPLELRWEVSCDPISDDWLPAEISAEELWTLWVDRYGDEWPDGIAPIYWSVRSSVPRSGVFETAPGIRQLRYPNRMVDNFLTYFTWPVNARTGEKLRWTELPVTDKRWNAERGDKGGFIQEATSWKPSAFQMSLDVGVIALASRLTLPESSWVAQAVVL